MITGSNSGIGKETAVGLARMGASIVMVCRDRQRGEAAAKEISMRAGVDGRREGGEEESQIFSSQIFQF